jgi:hypothetical protein
MQPFVAIASKLDGVNSQVMYAKRNPDLGLI